MNERTRRNKPRKQYRQRTPTPLGPAQVRVVHGRGARPVVVLASDGPDQWAVTPIHTRQPDRPMLPVSQFVERILGNSYLARNDVATLPVDMFGGHIQYVSGPFLNLVMAAVGDAMTQDQREELWIAGGGTRESLTRLLQPTSLTQ